MGVPDVTINLAPVIVAAVASMVIGSLWYSPVLFGNIWMKLSKITKKKINKAAKKGMTKSYLLALLGSFIMAYVLAHFVQYTTSASIGDGMQLGFYLWLGFVAPVSLGIVLWEGKPWKLWAINTGYYLVDLIVMACIIAIW